jgi:hypothetical protein
MTSGGKRYPAKADLGAGQRQGCWSDLIAPVSVTEARTTNATVPIQVMLEIIMEALANREGRGIEL